MLRSLIKKLPGAEQAFARLQRRFWLLRTGEPFPRGHFYSALPDTAWVDSHAETLFRKNVDLGASIDLREGEQEALLQELAAFYGDFGFPEEPAEGFRFHIRNSMYGRGSAFVLYAMLRKFRPRRVVEVGSGFTSVLMLDTDDLFLGSDIEFTFVEPYPERLESLLRERDRERCRVLAQPVQSVAPTAFEALGEGDLLFIDSSHVVKVGSDVNHLLFTVLPALKPGVIIHFHDIHWPFEGSKDWFAKGLAWNEAYLLRAFLQYNDAFEILFFNSFTSYRFAHLYRELLPDVFEKDPLMGSSIWLRKR